MDKDRISSWPSKIDKKEHLQRCARGVFAEKLRNAGFVSFEGEDLSWYKVVNHEVLQTVYIYSPFAMFPIFMTIGYGIHPLFIPAPIPQKVTIRGYGPNDELLTQVFLHTPQAVYDNETMVLCPTSPGRGAEELDEVVFPKFQQVHSIEDAYALHKARCLKGIADFQAERQTDKFPAYISSLEFIDEAIYLNDTDVYPICMAELNDRFQVCLSGTITAREQKCIARMEFQRDALLGKRREEFLAELEARKKRFIRKLEQKVGIQV